jgi:hypothetical protein
VPVFIQLQAVHRLNPTPLLVTCHKVRGCVTAINTITKTHGMRNINFLLQKLMSRNSRILRKQSSTPCSQQPTTYPSHEPYTSVHANPSYFPKIQFNIIPSSRLRLLSCPFFSGFSTKHCMHFIHTYACYIPPISAFSDLTTLVIFNEKHKSRHCTLSSCLQLLLLFSSS